MDQYTHSYTFTYTQMLTHEQMHRSTYTHTHTHTHTHGRIQYTHAQSTHMSTNTHTRTHPRTPTHTHAHTHTHTNTHTHTACKLLSSQPDYKVRIVKESRIVTKILKWYLVLQEEFYNIARWQPYNQLYSKRTALTTRYFIIMLLQSATQRHCCSINNSPIHHMLYTSYMISNGW